jgi:hypothetical protein
VKTTLEARIRIAGSIDLCALCDRVSDRMVGETEAYVAGTQDWVCPDCAFGSDKELAVFVYRPESGPPPPKCVDEASCFGHCPACAGLGKLLNVGRDHWIVCLRHGLKWCIGANIFSSWRDETEYDWHRNQAILDRCREVEPYEPRERFRTRIRGLCTRIRERLSNIRIRPEDDIPF